MAKLGFVGIVIGNLAMNGRYIPCGEPISSDPGYWLEVPSGYTWFTSAHHPGKHIQTICGEGLYKVFRLCRECGLKYGLEW